MSDIAQNSDPGGLAPDTVLLTNMLTCNSKIFAGVDLIEQNFNMGEKEGENGFELNHSYQAGMYV